MDLITAAERPNARRLKRLTLEATCFEEELIIHYIFTVIKSGGSITMKPKDESYPPKVGDFPGL